MTPSPDDVKTAAELAGPFSPQNFWPSVWMAIIGALGGLMSFYRKMKAGQTRAINVVELIGELFVSAMVGLVTYWICKSFNVDPWLTAVGAAVSGHMGTRAIFMGEQVLSKRFGITLPPEDPPKP